MGGLFYGSAEELMLNTGDRTVDLLFTDPPYGTGRTQEIHGRSYSDENGDGRELIRKLAVDAERVLTPTGVFAVFLDHRLVHWAHEQFVAAGLNPRGELIWHSMLGGVSKSWWSMKHQTILLFDLDGNGYFDYEKVPAKKRLAPRGDYGADKLKKWDSVIDYTMGPMSAERVGYPTQKPLGVVQPVVDVHCPTGGLVADPFCGSGSILVAASRADCDWVAADTSEDALHIAGRRVREDLGR